MSNYANRFNEQYLLSLGHVVAAIVASLGDDHPEVSAAMATALGDLQAAALHFPTGNPLAEVKALRSASGL